MKVYVVPYRESEVATRPLALVPCPPFTHRAMSGNLQGTVQYRPQDNAFLL